MKTTNQEFTISNFRFPLGRRGQPWPKSTGRRAGFSLIELLVVIAVMSILAGFTLVVVGKLKQKAYVNVANAELSQIENALEDYKNKYGTYPPSNGSLVPTINTLYYELSGVTFNPANQTYVTLDGASGISQGNYKNAFLAGGNSIDGILNCTKGGSEEGTAARNFLPSLKQNRIGAFTTAGGMTLTNLITSVRGPDARYMPLNVPDVNPFRYLYPGTNNPTSYDLWVQLVYGGKTNLVCNWSKQVILNSPLP